MTVVERADGRSVVTVDGVVDLATVPALRALLRDELADGCRSLVVDLAGVTHVDSVGLGTLVGIYKRARVLRVELVLWRPSPPVHQVLGLTGLHRVFRIELGDTVPDLEPDAVS